MTREELERLLDIATFDPGKWQRSDLVEVCAALPQLIAEVGRLRAENAQLGQAVLDGSRSYLQGYRAACHAAQQPIPMILHCPDCRARHVDAGEFATKVHHTHSCQSCGLTWRPAVVATVGVQFLPGFKDNVES